MPEKEKNFVQVRAGAVTLEGELAGTAAAEGVIVFAHGSGSGRFSPRNQYVAGVLRQRGFATLLVDLLTEPEEFVDVRTAEFRFDIGFLAERLMGASEWLEQQPETRGLGIGYFGASTGAAAALIAAAARPQTTKAVVSRGGRPDLAGTALARVQAPTLLIVGGDDVPVIALNRDAMRQLRCEYRLEIVSKATHLFEEPGALENVAELACDWFKQYLAGAAAQPQR